MADQPTAEQKRIAELEAQVAALSAPPAEQPTASSETVPGGKYLVGDQFVDANGEPLKGQK